MSIHGRSVASGLHELAHDIATGDRIVDYVRWYWTEGMPNRSPIVPRAVHDAMCASLAVLIHDEAEELVVCDRCKLAVENGAA